MEDHPSSPVWGMYVAWRNRAELAERRLAAVRQIQSEMQGFAQATEHLDDEGGIPVDTAEAYLNLRGKIDEWQHRLRSHHG